MVHMKARDAGTLTALTAYVWDALLKTQANAEEQYGH